MIVFFYDQRCIRKMWEDPSDATAVLIPRLEKIIDRPLTGEERQKMKDADRVKRNTMMFSQEQYADTISPIVGFDPDEILKTMRRE